MHRLKSIKLYFFAILKLFALSFRNYYFKSKFYNRNLITFIPTRIFYNPSSFLTAPLTSSDNDFYKIRSTQIKLLWEINQKDKLKFENLHNFLWLAKLDRKYNKNITKDIINSWINNFYNYDPMTWDFEITAKRIISWVSNTDITLEDSDKKYKKKFLLSLVKQSNFLQKNINNLSPGSTKIICCAAILLSGMIFKENDFNYKAGIKELEKVIKNYFHEDGFPKSRNPEEVFVCTKYLILIREWFKESQQTIPDYLNDIIFKIGNCYAFLSCSNKQFPLFNGANEINYEDYNAFLKSLNYKFINKNNEFGNLIKIKKKKLELIMDCGNPPQENFIKNYQAGCLAIEIFSGKQKIICNSGHGKYLSSKYKYLSQSTAAHSSLYLNDTSSCIFQKNEAINAIYGNSLLKKHKITEKNYSETNDFYSLSVSHNGYEKRYGYIHKRSIKITKKDDKIFGTDELKKTKNCLNSIVFNVRFHIHPDNRIVKTKAGNAILISLKNGEGWKLHSNSHLFEIEKGIFFGNKQKIINNESVFITNNLNGKSTSIHWLFERVS